MKKTLLLAVLLFAVCGIMQAQKITLVSPNGGETMVSGSQQAITWSYSGLNGDETIVIALEGTSDYGPIAYCKVSQGAFAWLAGQKMDQSFAKPAGDYKIIIETSGNDAIYDLSDAPFTLLPPVSVIALMTPNGGETLAKGSDYDINWSCAGKEGFVTLTLLKDDQPLGPIAENLPAASLRYRWRIGTPLLSGVVYGAGGNYRIQVQWRVRPVMGKSAMDEAAAKGQMANIMQKNSDRSDNAFSIIEAAATSQQKGKTEKEE